MSVYHRLVRLCYLGGVGVVCGVVYHFEGAVGHFYLVDNGRRGRDDVEVVFTLNALLDYLHVEEPEESAAEAESQRDGGLRLEAQRSVVELELFQRVAEVYVLCAVRRVDAAEHHRVYLAVAGKRLFRRSVSGSYSIADLGLTDGLDGSRDVSDLARLESGAGHKLGGAHNSGLHNGEFRAGRHHSDTVAGLNGAFLYPDVGDNALVAVVVAVEYQCLERSLSVSLRRGYGLHHRLHYRVDIDTHFRGYFGGVLGGNAYYVLYLLLDLLGVRGGEVYLIDDRDHLQVVFYCEVGIRKGLRLDALGGVNDEQSALARNQ